MKFVLLGEQASGKSSLLVAFYGSLVNRRAGEMELVRTIDDVGFLSDGLESFGRRESLRRTEIDTQARLAIEVAHHGSHYDIELPDRSGEMLRHMLDRRIWDPELQRQVSDAAGAMLFLRADQLPSIEADPGASPASAPTPAFDLWRTDVELAFTQPSAHESVVTARMAGVEPGPFGVPRAEPFGDFELTPSPQPAPPSPAPPDEPQDSEPEPWSPALMPPDVRTVDLLQALLEERSDTFPLAVVVSAWDRAPARAALPSAWLADRVPLLEQFLTSHEGQLPHAIFGVSAQGEDFEDAALGPAGSEDPWDRAFVIGPDGSRATFSDPFAWLIDAVT